MRHLFHEFYTMFRYLIQKSGYIPNKLKASKKEKGRLSSPQQAMGFSPQVYNHTVAQMLLTWEDFDDESRLHNLSNTLERLLQLHAIPIINENDSVSSDEYSVGDNDTLAALTAKCIHADLVVLLSDIDGLYTKDPHSDPSAQLIPVVEKITDTIEALAKGAGSSLGTGGMATKVSAAKIVTKEGIDMIIANGAKADILYDIVDGKQAGTRFLGERS